MDLNQYEQCLIKCDYISAVCDQLIRSLETAVLSKINFNNKLSSDPQFNSISTKYYLLQNSFKDKAIEDNHRYQQRNRQVQTKIKQKQYLFKKSKQQITFLKQSKYQNVTSTRLASKQIRQLFTLQSELMQLRRLLNYELQNLNCLETSGIQVKEAIETYDKKQALLKSKFATLIHKQNSYMQCGQMEDQYGSLLLTKRKIEEQNCLFDQKKHIQTFNKISAIAQSKENLSEMQRYQKQLKLLIKQQTFIIDQIENRQMRINVKNHPTQDLQDDNEVFEQQISSLRKTIANRKFHQRTKHIHTPNKLETFLNNNTPKNRTTHSNKHENERDLNQNISSLFKIQIQPVSHFSPRKIRTQNPNKLVHRNSLPSKINQNLSKYTKRQSSYGSQNKLQNLETIQIEALQKILKSKQQKIKHAIHNSHTDEVHRSTPVLKNNQRTPIKSAGRLQLSANTEPIQINNKQLDIDISPNSRFIEQIIQSKDSYSLSGLKNNVRVRTKKSESQKYKFIESRMNFSNQQKSKPFTKSQIKPKNPQNNIKSAQKQKKIVKNVEQNEFLQQNLPQKFRTEQHKIKYKDKLSDLEHEIKGIDIVFKKIEQLRKDAEQNLDKVLQIEGHTKTKIKSQKVKVYKLSSARKYGNAISFQRKGKAEGIEESDSDGSFQLQKIQEQEQSIRNTLQSIAENQKQA